MAVLFGQYKVRSLKRVEGVSNVIWEFELQGISMKLINSPFGNSIYSTSKEQELVMKDVFDAWVILSTV